MRCTFTIFLDGLEPDDYRYILRKHAKEFDVVIASSYPMHGGMYAVIFGETRNVVNMLDYMAGNGFTVELISMRN